MTASATIRHTEATRNAILEAAVDLFLERRSEGFSVQDVADRAGLTHRTVYRYFPTRQELLGATAQHLAPRIAEVPLSRVSTVDEWIATLGAHFARTEANFESIRSIVVATLAADDMRLFGHSVRDRDTHLWKVFRRQFPYLDDGDSRRTFATLRHLTSSTSYIYFRLRFRLSPAEATDEIQSTASLVVEQAALRERAASDRRRR
jgi:AcrR family transcriptional regulator